MRDMLLILCKTATYKETTAEAESEIARYSAVDIGDFRDGAVDKERFLKAYKELGQERWQKVYDAAKYISDGNGHRRARLYADVMTGDLKIKEVTQKVKEKRDKDYLRIYGLVPLSKANAEKEVLSRYEYIQQFKKESKQFGAQKQASAASAIRIAMENLQGMQVTSIRSGLPGQWKQSRYNRSSQRKHRYDMMMC